MRFADISRIMPNEEKLIPDMWFKELNSKQDEEDGVEDFAELGNLITLFAAIFNIKLSDLLFDEQDRRSYRKFDGLLWYANKLPAKFESLDDIELCH